MSNFTINKTDKETGEVTQGLNAATNAQHGFNQAVSAGRGTADGLLRKITQMAAAYASVQGVQRIIGLSDTMASTSARLDLIVDDSDSVANLEAKIFASSQRSRASYQATAAAVAKLGLQAGKAFTGNDEMIAFTELMNKNFAIGGASIQEQTSAMYQLTQAMSAGNLQGDEYRSIIENANHE